MNPDLDEAIRALDKARMCLEAVKHKGSCSIAEMREIRKEILDTVRHNIDPYALVMPEKRHY